MSIKSRIVRGIGFGALAVAMLGFATTTIPPVVDVPVVRGVGGFAFPKKIEKEILPQKGLQIIHVITGHIKLQGNTIVIIRGEANKEFPQKALQIVNDAAGHIETSIAKLNAVEVLNMENKEELIKLMLILAEV